MPVTTGKKEDYYSALDAILRHYNSAGFYIKTIHCDGEYRNMMDKVKDDLNVHMNYANPGDHVPEAERNIRTLKERFRAAYHRLPYKAIPAIMIRHLAMKCMHDLNLFPVSHGAASRVLGKFMLVGSCWVCACTKVPNGVAQSLL